MNKFVSLIPKQAARYGNREALRCRDYASGDWKSLSWNDFASAIDRAACAMSVDGIECEDKIAVFSQNTTEILITHYAAFSHRAVPVPIYATSSRDEAAYIINDSGSKVLFVGEQQQYDIAVKLFDDCPKLEKIVVFDPTVMLNASKKIMHWHEWLTTGDDLDETSRKRIEQSKRDGVDTDLMYLIYTSGTTGVPKGVMLTHSNFNAAMSNHAARIKIDDKTDLSLCFLPLSHIFELGWTMFCLIKGVRVAINRNPKEIQKSIKEIEPTCMCSVPRFWEKVYTTVKDNLDEAKPVVKMLIKRGLKVGRVRNIKYVRMGKRPPKLLEKQYRYFDKKIFAKLRRAIGIPGAHFFPTAGAMLSDNITEFLHSVGINIVIGYGLSETNASVCFYPSKGWEIGTVGVPIPDVKVKIGKNQEILVKGPTVMKGYYNKPEETAQALDADGWFHTGDCGEITPHGHIVLTERIKDLFKTSNGKYIAPQVLETMLGQDKFIEQVALIGDGRQFVSALIVPNYQELENYAFKKRIRYRDIDDLVDNRDIHKMIELRIADYQRDMASYEQIKHFILLPRPFTMENGELTNTLKIRRPVIYKRYAKLIDAIYAVEYRKPRNEKNSENKK